MAVFLFPDYLNFLKSESHPFSTNVRAQASETRRFGNCFTNAQSSSLQAMNSVIPQPKLTTTLSLVIQHFAICLILATKPPFRLTPNWWQKQHCSWPLQWGSDNTSLLLLLYLLSPARMSSYWGKREWLPTLSCHGFLLLKCAFDLQTVWLLDGIKSPSLFQTSKFNLISLMKT